MPKQQVQEWVEAQKIVITTNLTAAAKKHLQFLEVVDKKGNLYDGPVLEKAIFRYKYYWLPLLAEHTDSPQLQESRLVVPLDCEWIWHCHRLNPVRYMVDCIELFGKILDPGSVVVSSIEGACKKHTEEIWTKKYPHESYEFDLGDHNSKFPNVPSTNYDLISAVKRQSSFYHKVSAAIFRDDHYLEGALQRYKGFLHLVSRNIEKKLNNPCVPTYDIDLMWHTHQLYPRSYCKDVMALVGQVLHHDDTDTDQSKGGKLDVSIQKTTQQWSQMFGSMYWRVGSRSSDATMDMDGEHLTTVTERCWCLSEQMVKDKSAARCKCIHADDIEVSFARTARCLCLPEQMVNEKSAARCKCIPAHDMEASFARTARCLCLPEQMVNEKLVARCKCIPADDMEAKEVSCGRTAKSWCLTEHMDGQKLIIESIASGAIEV